MYIDCLLDSSIPYDILDEYSSELGASAFAVSNTIREERSSTPSSSSASDTVGNGAGSYGTLTANDDSSVAVHPRKHTPKDIFRGTEDMPLLRHHNGSDDNLDRRQSLASVASGPVPNLPWLENAELDSDDPIVTWAIWVNMIANVVLLAGKAAVIASVPSLSVLASLVDAVLDFLSTAIVWTTTRLISSSQQDQYKYPVGRRR